ncbi:MAG: type II toxin-antitoxin system VapC family toxin [Candidatus Dormiibacterota bacterium]
MIVVDASVVVDWVAPGADLRSPAMMTLDSLISRGDDLSAPGLLQEEVANALLTGIRRGRWSGTEADGAHRELLRLPILLVDDPRDRARAWELARRFDNHPIYDLVYVAVAERTHSRLITADRTLRSLLVDYPWVVATGPIEG